MMQEFVQQVENMFLDRLNDIHTAIPGTITVYDPGSGMAEVQPHGTIKMQDGKTLQYPSVSGVPVVFPQGGGQKSVIAYPVKEGDGCLILICENDIQSWVTGAEDDRSNRMKFDLTNAVCIPGMFQSGSEAAQKAAEEEAIVIKNEETMIVMKKDELSAAHKDSSFYLKENTVGLSCKGKFVQIGESGISMEGNLTVHGTVTEV